MKIFEKVNLLKPNFFQKIFKISPKSNFVLELQNLLAENEECINSIKQSDIDTLHKKYGVKINEYKKSRIAFLDKYIYYICSDEVILEKNKKQALYLCKLFNLNEKKLETRILEEEKKFFLMDIKKLFDSNDDPESLLDKIKKLKEKFELSESDVETIYDKEGKSLYRNKVVKTLTEKNEISESVKKGLNLVREELKISNDDEKEIFQEIRDDIYRKKVLEVIADNKISDEERENLSKVRDFLGFSESEGFVIYSTECQAKIQSFVNQLIQRRRMSPAEEKQLNEMVKGLNVVVSYNNDGLFKLRKFWEIENGTLQPINSPINIQKTEQLYYSAKIEWYEERTKTTYVSYNGITTNFRITKGISLRSGMIAPERHTEEYMKLIDTGDVYFTNKRIIFVGEHGNKIIPFSKILYITPYSDGLEIGKDTGKKPFFKFHDVETMGIYLARLLKDS